MIRPEAATRSLIWSGKYEFYQGNMNFIRESQGMSLSDICGNRVLVGPITKVELKTTKAMRQKYKIINSG